MPYEVRAINSKEKDRRTNLHRSPKKALPREKIWREKGFKTYNQTVICVCLVFLWTRISKEQQKIKP